MMISDAICAICHKPEWDHKVRTNECPAGMRSRIGYTQYGPTTFVPMKEESDGAAKKQQ